MWTKTGLFYDEILRVKRQIKLSKFSIHMPVITHPALLSQASISLRLVVELSQLQ
jgi:hypothetical protein